MASDAQIEANRKNAQKSTVPRTDEGKAVSCQNAVKHGLSAKHTVIDSPHFKEDPAEYESFVRAVFTELAPETVLQEQMAQRIAVCLWRSRRAIIAETAQIETQLRDVDRRHKFEMLHRARLPKRFAEGVPNRFAPDPESVMDQLIGASQIPDEEFSYNLLRYEMRLDRQLYLAYRLFHHMKNGASADPTAAPFKLPSKKSESDKTKPILRESPEKNEPNS